MTGSVDTYLLLKEMEENGDESEKARTDGEPMDLDLTADWSRPFV